MEEVTCLYTGLFSVKARLKFIYITNLSTSELHRLCWFILIKAYAYVASASLRISRGN